jgi:thioredoxin reductase
VLEVLIIGGGIHGTHLANVLLNRTSLTHDDIRILDPHEKLLHVWDRCTRNCGMRYLRSPSVHHIAIDPFSLDKYARRKEVKNDGNFIPPKDRPSLDLFQQHCQMVIEENRLQSMLIQGRGVDILNQGSHWSILTDTETINTRFVILAIGMNEQPFWPDWAVNLRRNGAPVNHVFDPAFHPDRILNYGPICIVGSGISGAQLALKIAETTDNRILLIAKEPVRVVDFDFDPGWLGPKYLDGFRRQPLEKRRILINEAREKGSIPRDTKKYLEKAFEMNRIAIHVDEIDDSFFSGETISLSGIHGRYECSQAILATGFEQKRPGNGFIDQAIHELGLKTFSCGFPVIGEGLKWHDRVFVSGPLSELQIGPSARNIAGAREAGRIILSAFPTS